MYYIVLYYTVIVLYYIIYYIINIDLKLNFILKINKQK